MEGEVMDLDTFHTEELVELREVFRVAKDWGYADVIRNYLDSKFSFIFDTPNGWVVYHLNYKYFYNKPSGMTNRQYVEMRIKQDIDANRRFDAWLHSMQESSKKYNTI